MKQLQIMLGRLRNPSVAISVLSEVAALLLLFNIKIDVNIVTGAIAAICSILVLLGIISDPDTQHKGYGDDLLKCNNCNKISRHVLVNGKMICEECGCEYKGQG